MNEKKELNNRLLMELLVKSSRIDWLINEMLNMNNSIVLDQNQSEIVADDYNKVLNNIVDAITNLGNIAENFAQKFKEAIKHEQEQIKDAATNDVSNGAPSNEQEI